MPIDFDALKIREPLDFGDYNEQLRGQVLDVWVNLDYRTRARLAKDDLTETDYKDIYRTMWGLSSNDYEELMARVDPLLFDWLLAKTWEMVAAYGEERKKGDAASPPG